MDNETWAIIGPIYDSQFDALVKQAARIVGAARAEDVVQDAFLRAIKAVECGISSEDITAMLSKIVRHTGIDQIRRGPKEMIVSESNMTRMIEGKIDSGRVVTESLSAAAPPTPEEHLFAVGFGDALLTLPVEDAQAFILTELRGCSTREAGNCLGVDAMTITRRAERARTAIARSLQQ